MESLVAVSDDRERKFLELEDKLSSNMQWRKFTLNTVQQLVALFAEDMKKQWKDTYSKTHLYQFEAMWKNFVGNIIINTLEWDRELFHEYFVQKHGLKYASLYANRRVFNEENTKIYFDEFLKKIKSIGIDERSQATLLKHDAGFYQNIISSLYKSNRNKFFKDFGYTAKKIWFVYKKIDIMTDKVRQKRIDGFISYMKENQINSFSPHTIKKYSQALTLDLERNFRTQEDAVNWPYILEKFFKDPEIIQKFKKLLICNEVRWERIEKFLSYMKERQLTYFSPYSIKKYSVALDSDFRKHFRTEQGQIDRLYILYKFFKDPEIIKKFRHERRKELDGRRYLDWLKHKSKSPEYRAYGSNSYKYANASSQKTVETDYIEKEEYMLYQEAIKKLSPADQKIIVSFLNEENVDQEMMVRIISALRTLCYVPLK